MRVLVTGSDGFVGSHLVAALGGHTVLGIDRANGTDLLDPRTAGMIREFDPERVVHLASACSTPGSISDPMGTYRDTVTTTAHLFDALDGRPPVIVTSSVKARDGMTPYGAAKRMVETWSFEMAATYGYPVVVNRPGTIYGPGQQGSADSGWIAWFTLAREQGLEVTVNGHGGQVRDLLHVSDYVALLVRQVEDPVPYRGLWDIGGGPENAVTVMQMVRHLDLAYRHGPPRYGDADHYVGFNDAPGWAPTVRWWESETLAA